MRTLIALAALSAFAAPLAAQSFAQADTTGALAGRTPVKAVRVAAEPAACGKTMHSIPAGKLPHYGTHALPATCDTVAVALNDTRKTTRSE